MKEKALLIAVAALMMLPVHAALSADWMEARLGDFRIISNGRKERTVQVIRGIELHRIAFAKFFDVPPISPGIPVTVFVLQKAEFDRFIPNASKVGGMYFDSELGPVIALNQETLGYAQEIIYHELTHLLLHRSKDPAGLPTWLDEGYSELLSTVRLEGSKLKVGWPAEGRLRTISRAQPMPVDQLLRLDRHDKDYNQTSRSQTFYGQSWNLVHFWKLSGAPIVSDITGYVEAVSSGRSVDEALRVTFPNGTTALDKALRDYSRKTKFAYFEFELQNFPDDEQFELLLKAADVNSVADELSAWVATFGISTSGSIEYLDNRIKANQSAVSLVAKSMLDSRTLGRAHDLKPANAACDTSTGSSVFHSLCGALLAQQVRTAEGGGSGVDIAKRAYSHFRHAHSLNVDDYSSLVSAAYMVPPGHPDRATLIVELEKVVARTPSLSQAAYALSNLCADTDLRRAIAYAQQGLKHDFVPARVLEVSRVVTELQAAEQRQSR